MRSRAVGARAPVGGCAAARARARALTRTRRCRLPPPAQASDDRGIDVVRNKIKLFATKKVTLPPGRHKIVILDEVRARRVPGVRCADFSVRAGRSTTLL